MLRKRLNILVCLSLFVLGLFVFSQALNVHGLEYRDDEIFYFKSTQEMVHHHDYLSPTYFGENRFQKPILFYWFVLLSYKIFGINWFAARFVAVFFASLTLVIVWIFARDLFNKRVATLSVFILMTVPLFFRHAKNVVPDIVLNFFIVSAIYCFYQQTVAYIQVASSTSTERPVARKKFFSPVQWYNFLFVILCSLGFMIKGFVAFIIPLLTIVLYACLIRRPRVLFQGRHFVNMLVGGLIIFPWFFYMVKVHGEDYVNHMVVKETQGRILSDPGCNTFVAWLKMLGDHLVYYFRIIFSYFAPWSLPFFVSVLYAVWKIHVLNKKDQHKVQGISDRDDVERTGLFLLLCWIGVTIAFFSSLYFVINHYMLAISVPFAILVSYFLTAPMNCATGFAKAVPVFRKYFLIGIFILGFFAFSFLVFFLAQGSSHWAPLFLFLFVTIFWMMLKKDHYWRAIIVSLFMVFVLSQSVVLNKAKLTAHSVLGHFAETIRKDAADDYLVGIGSHDLHEKEFQVYFDKQVQKASVSWEWGMQESLTKFFSRKEKIYCLITLRDYDKYLTKIPNFTDLQIIQEDYIFRKRMNVDKNFFKALVRFDQLIVHQYLKEKIVLIKKEKDGKKE